VNAVADVGEKGLQWFAKMGTEQTAGQVSSQTRMAASPKHITELFVDMPRAMTVLTRTDSSSIMDERLMAGPLVGQGGSVRRAVAVRTALPTRLLHECNALAVLVIRRGCIVSLSSTE
jgi:hypothetical protein